MANRHIRVAALTGLLVGVLMGAGVVHYAELTADLLIARTDYNYRSQRYNRELDMQGLNRDDGIVGARRLEWSNDETRTEKAPATGLRGAALERLRYCEGQSPVRRSQCLVNAANAILQEAAGEE
ncbi:MAG TPA: hypothetical protein DEB30_00755 [Candidatus Peribacter riflensis]|uniref:Uncharacterized protein n=1 Tax=Candidatus Peribacter riflensis TaxID=1735162 RepID=A0A0S1SRE6_9BACT|nr:MAG: hypothetical protein PeribacterA2_0273 [Candidatus Peribacter riflensis]OGJ78243.1 MAG: hypothetical protein A2398_05120 [Candidatus Peribacteria bacterium RIFOXYB1_FULL_57_12]OGJ82995.1 MAG: hypothetical protein A2412_05240 [Candidatus Peribacteria bacterium RIFOXYC1_FULL_58_8]ALM10767.1 MAG: hypothetical protein PeribacterB2_0273 [Candidatus Peribacter riflensis]ALM11869.1 MAG: hypothetical protein PeribacterC2_0272 [Candidatus Peribacter riflensis]